MRFYYLNVASFLGIAYWSNAATQSAERKPISSMLDLIDDDKRQQIVERIPQLWTLEEKSAKSVMEYSSRRRLEAIDLSHTINGKSNNAEAGKSISLTSDGNSMMVGGFACAILFNYNTFTDAWERIDFSEAMSTGQGYFAVTLSNDGNHIAIGSANNDKDGMDSGEVRAFKNNKNSGNGWRQIGNKFNGGPGDTFGNDVALSSDGETLVIGACGGGYVSVHKLNSSYQEGYGNGKRYSGKNFKGFGFSISLSGDGKVLAVGAPFYNNNRGYMRVYSDMDTHDNTEPFQAQYDDKYFGYSVSLSLDGMRLATGAWGNNFVRCFQYTPKDKKWVRLGYDIEGNKGYNNAFGWSVSLSGSGDLIAIGDPWHAHYGNKSGKLFMYKIDSKGTAWEKVADISYGNQEIHDECGATVSLSSDEKKLVAACPGSNEGAYNGGQIQVYSVPLDLDIDLGSYYDDYTTGMDLEYDDELNDFDWEDTKTVVNGENKHGELGQSISFSYDGTAMVVGGISEAKLYERIDDEWECKKDFAKIIAPGRGVYTVAISSDGDHIAVGAPNNDEAGKDAGQVAAFKRNDEEWYQVGRKYNGKENEYLGNALAISKSGEVLVAAAYGGAYIWIFKLKESTGMYVPTKKRQGDKNDGFGFSLSVSGDGVVACVGAPFFDNNRGKIQIYDVDKDEFSYPLTGDFPNNFFGFSVSLSLNGMKAAAGAWGGYHARAFEFQSDMKTWKKMGTDIEGIDDAFGWSVSLSEDGKVLAVGAPSGVRGAPYSGRAKLFLLNENRKDYEMYATDIHGERVNDSCGFAVEVAPSGVFLAMGCPGHDFTAFNAGQVQVYNIPAMTLSPTSQPTPKPTGMPTATPTTYPSSAPVAEPTSSPSLTHSSAPTSAPTVEASSRPSAKPTPFKASEIDFKDDYITDDDNFLITDDKYLFEFADTNAINSNVETENSELDLCRLVRYYVAKGKNAIESLVDDVVTRSQKMAYFFLE